MKKILLKIGIIFTFVFAISFGIDHVYRQMYHIAYEFPNNIFILPEIKDKYDLVKLGNSHSEDGITFDKYALKGLSLASVSQPFEYDLAYLKMHSRQIKEGATILISISPFTFSQKKAQKGDSLQTNYYDGRISPFLIPHINVGDYLQSRIFPFLRSGYLLREKYMEGIKKRISEEEKWPDPTPTTEQVSADKESNDTSESPLLMQNRVLNIDPKDVLYNVEAIQNELSYPTNVPIKKFIESEKYMVNKWANPDDFGVQYFDANRKDLEKIILFCLKNKWRPVLITVPITDILLEGLSADYMQVYLYDNISKMNLHGAEYFDFTKNKQLTGNYFLFENSDHLNSHGAVIFSYVLLRCLIDNGYLPNTADGYDYRPLYK